jgi:hypothetical protein
MPSTPSTQVQLHRANVPAPSKLPIPVVYTAPVAIATAHTNVSGLDLYQVINQSGKVVWSLSSSGVVTLNPVNPSATALMGRHEGTSFATAFPDPTGQKLDIYQIHDGSKVVYHVDYQGNAFTP